MKYFFCKSQFFIGLFSIGLVFLHGETKIEEYFPELSKILSDLEDNSPILLENNQLVQEQIGNEIVADSVKGLKLSINLSAQSIHEDRPDQSFYHRYRNYGSIYARKPLFHWGALQAESEIADKRTEIAKLNYQQVSHDLNTQVKHSYLDLLILQKKKEVRKESLLINQESLNRQIRQEKLGLSSSLDVSESNASYLENEMLLADLNQSLINSINQFKSITGWEGEITFFDQNSSFEDLISSKGFKKEIPQIIAGITSQTMDRLEKEIEIEKKQIKIAESELRPKLNMVGGFYQDQVALANSDANLLRNNFVIGVEANWAIWDSSKSRGQKSASLAKKRRLEYALEREIKNFRIYVGNLRQNLLSLGNRIQMSKKLLEVAESRYTTSKIEFNANRISANRHLESKIALDKAKINQLESVCQYLKTHDLYLKAIRNNP